MTATTQAGGALRRELGVFGATVLGLGSIIGTGVFVSIGIGSAVSGPAVLLAIAVGGCLAACNALSSAQLAANHPTSGGTYEYGYRYLSPTMGFAAGWMFLAAKSASAAAAAMGFAGYTLALANAGGSRAGAWIGVGAVVAMTALVLGGLRRSNLVNAVIVSVTIGSLLFFVVSGLPRVGDASRFRPFFGGSGGLIPGLPEACALMFVAYTGYGRIATMGEEVREPRRTIPRAIIATLAVSMTLYLCVGLVGVGSGGAFGQGAAPLSGMAAGFGVPGAAQVVAVGAIAAMLGVLLNLLLGLSRVALAMGRRGDLPAVFARVNSAGTTPAPAVLLVGAIILGLTAIGSVRLAWSFSAFTVLVYYAITNLAALRLSRAERLYHPAVAWAGLAGCLSLAFWVEPRAWAAGLAVLGAGLGGRAVLGPILGKARTGERAGP